MLNSINTNNSALIALQALGRSKSTLATTERRVSTGQAVASSKDNGAIWAVAQGQRGQAKALDAVTGGLQRAQSILDVTLNVTQQLSDQNATYKTLVLKLLDRTIPDVERQAFVDSATDIIDTWNARVKSASFDGANLINSPTGTGSVTLPVNADGSAQLSLAKTTMTTGYYFNFLRPAVTTSDTLLKWVLNQVAITDAKLASKIAYYSAKSREVDSSLAAVSKTQDSLNGAVGNLVDADMGKESAKLVAGQAKQQLGVQTLSVASQSTTYLQSLFR
jgi:flagellin